VLVSHKHKAFLVIYFNIDGERQGTLLVDAFSIHSGLKEGNSLLVLSFSFALEYTINKIQENQE